MEQKKFMDISRAKFGDEITAGNIDGFEVGDIINISTKVDGANASIRYDKDTYTLAAFSRKKSLDEFNTLSGFFNYVQNLNAEDFKETPSYVIFGEWLVSHTIKYRQDAYRKWYVFDIYDTETEGYLTQDRVKKFCEEHNLIYVKVLYEGPFISWDHCKSFCKNENSDLGDTLEGIVIKNQTKLNDPNTREPFVVKIINSDFSEIKKDTRLKNRLAKLEDPQHELAKAHAQEIVDMIVTRNRVLKEIHKMIDEQILPEKITAQDMKTVAQNLPKRIYADCVKEEFDLVKEAGEFFGKFCGSKAMSWAKDIILGGDQ